MKKNIVVLGATGTVGSKIAQILIHEGHHLTLVARHTEGLETYRDQGAEIIAAEINDADQLTRAFTGADSAFVLLPDNVKAENTAAASCRWHPRRWPYRACSILAPKV